MWQGLVRTARQFFHRTRQSLWPERSTPVRPSAPTTPPADPTHLPLEKIVLTAGVSNTLFEDFAAHRSASRGDEETGWVLMGYREPRSAVITATLPAGARRDAGVAHVRFNSAAQELGNRILRRTDKRLRTLGVAHTHPGALRRPSDGDYQGDSEWIKTRPGGEGVFAIGTAEANGQLNGDTHRNGEAGLFFSWFALRQGDSDYRPLPLELSPGDDVAKPLHAVWGAIEAHAERLDRLFRQQQILSCEPIHTKEGPALAVRLPLAEPGSSLCVLLRESQTRYLLVRGGQVLTADCPETRVDVGVYQVLGELAKSG